MKGHEHRGIVVTCENCGTDYCHYCGDSNLTKYRELKDRRFCCPNCGYNFFEYKYKVFNIVTGLFWDGEGFNVDEVSASKVSFTQLAVLRHTYQNISLLGPLF